jgi:hypothetical protein
MPDPLDALVLDLLEWIGPKARPYREVIEAWRTSCPRLPVWEEANERGFIEQRHAPGAEAVVSVSALGAKFLAERRRILPEPGRRYHLVHANVAHARAPLDSPLMAGFVSQVEEVNSLARSAAGFVVQPVLPDEGAVYTAPFLLNVSLWESVESLDAFTHQGAHAAALERRGEWFEQERTTPRYVLYWVPEGHVVTEREVKERLDHLGEHGATPFAFTFERRFTLTQALAFASAR